MRFAKSIGLAMVLVAGLATTGSLNGQVTQVVSSPAGAVCPHCGRVHASPSTNVSSYQAQAQAEAEMMAQRRYKGHVRGTIPGVNFCGVGWSSSSSNAPTCTPSRGMTLVADAVARGADGWYRVRYWR